LLHLLYLEYRLIDQMSDGRRYIRHILLKLLALNSLLVHQFGLTLILVSDCLHLQQVLDSCNLNHYFLSRCFCSRQLDEVRQVDFQLVITARYCYFVLFVCLVEFLHFHLEQSDVLLLFVPYFLQVRYLCC
jgi:hypothetical protein